MTSHCGIWQFEVARRDTHPTEGNTARDGEAYSDPFRRQPNTMSAAIPHQDNERQSPNHRHDSARAAPVGVRETASSASPTIRPTVPTSIAASFTWRNTTARIAVIPTPTCWPVPPPGGTAGGTESRRAPRRIRRHRHRGPPGTATGLTIGSGVADPRRLNFEVREAPTAWSTDRPRTANAAAIAAISPTAGLIQPEPTNVGEVLNRMGAKSKLTKHGCDQRGRIAMQRDPGDAAADRLAEITTAPLGARPGEGPDRRRRVRRGAGLNLQIVSGDLPTCRSSFPATRWWGDRHATVGDDVGTGRLGEAVGVSWFAGSCGHCTWCRRGRQNLCEQAQSDGLVSRGGYTTSMVARSDCAFRLPDSVSPRTHQPGRAAALAPLLCGGVIGYRSLRIAGVNERSSGVKLGLLRLWGVSDACPAGLRGTGRAALRGDALRVW